MCLSPVVCGLMSTYKTILTRRLVDVRTALSLPALGVPGKTLDDVKRASVQARDGQIDVGGVVLHAGA